VSFNIVHVLSVLALELTAVEKSATVGNVLLFGKDTSGNPTLCAFCVLSSLSCVRRDCVT